MTLKSQERCDEALVEAAQNGHLESFGVLYERYHSAMVALAYSGGSLGIIYNVINGTGGQTDARLAEWP